jgi:hypothetical protein
LPGHHNRPADLTPLPPSKAAGTHVARDLVEAMLAWDGGATEKRRRGKLPAGGASTVQRRNVDDTAVFHPLHILPAARTARLLPARFAALTRAFFDPTWCCRKCKPGTAVAHTAYPDWGEIHARNDSASEPAAAALLTHGAFAYHWHDAKRRLEPGSWLDAFDKVFARLAAGRLLSIETLLPAGGVGVVH